MPLPIAPNTTCDIYRVTNSPPAAPDVAGVRCYLGPRGQSTLTTGNYQYELWVGFFTGSNPNWTNMKVSAAPAGWKDNAERVHLGAVVLD